MMWRSNKQIHKEDLRPDRAVNPYFKWNIWDEIDQDGAIFIVINMSKETQDFTLNGLTEADLFVKDEYEYYYVDAETQAGESDQTTKSSAL